MFDAYLLKMDELLKNIDTSKVPTHVAIIMDGNGRWAKQQGKHRVFGHQKGVSVLKEIIKASIQIGVKYLTLYTFSKENWNRPKDEVEALMDLLVQSIDNELNELKNNGVRLNVIGDLKSLPETVQNKLNVAIVSTAKNDKLILSLALSYSGRWEIINAANKIITEIKENKLSEIYVSESLFEKYLTTKSIPDPELLIRTGGELRISNFLLWQIAYTELFFTNILWPDFNTEIYYKAILSFQNRERRFGKTSEQLYK